MKHYKKTINCLLCKNKELKEIFSLGQMPLANSFLKKELINKEIKVPLSMVLCPNCSLVQLGTIPSPDSLFKNYKYLSSASKEFVYHLSKIPNLFKTGKVLDIGSNDGTLLKMFLNKGFKVTGVDPALNLANFNNEINVVPDFFNYQIAKEIFKKNEKYDVITALNVIAHSACFVDMLKGIKYLLKDDGIAMFEFAYIFDTLLKGYFDTVYHEHVFSFSLTAFNEALKSVGLIGFDVEKINVQGGSLRVFAKKEKAKITKNYNSLLNYEYRKNINNVETYNFIPKNINNIKKELLKVIKLLSKKHGKIIGLGAPARGMTIINSCNISNKYIKYIIDDTPLKKDHFTPGMHIPIVGWDQLNNDSSDVFLLLSWNYKKEILNKLKQKVKNGKLIIPMPNVKVENF
jgi:2-polyprenyl-3-methyl-5-hydroxy-6-metoxy-1,4-benzoquinol methylase